MEETQQNQQSQQKDAGTVEISKSTLWMIISGILGVLLIVSVFTSGFGIKGVDSPTGLAVGAAPSPSPSPSPSPQPGANEVALVEAKELVDNDASLGKDSAKLVMIEFSDFQCPFCARFRQETFDAIKRDYIDTGKIKFVYRDFPLGFHQYAEKAAEAAECAKEQDKFWEYHDKLYSSQDEWGATGITGFKKYAEELGLDSGKFNNCLDTGKYREEVAKDLADGSRAGIGGTPGFVIGKTLVSGAQPYAAFRAAIEAELAK